MGGSHRKLSRGSVHKKKSLIRENAESESCMIDHAGYTVISCWEKWARQAGPNTRLKVFNTSSGFKRNDARMQTGGSAPVGAETKPSKGRCESNRLVKR